MFQPQRVQQSIYRKRGTAMQLGGIHHITAITGHASGNLAFYTDVLGLRLVKKTVNQDDVSAYHLFYADELASPGTGMTFFDWNAIGPQQRGAGQVAATAFRVPSRAALERWVERFDARGVAHGAITERAGRAVLPFSDPEGQPLELVDDTAGGTSAGVPPGVPWQQSPVPTEWAIRGLEGVTIAARALAPT